MVERICPQCQHGNALDNHFCGHCGVSLERQELSARQDAGLTVSNVHLPVQFKQVGQTLAVSLAALAAEAGIAWLRRRVERMNLPASVQQPASVAPVAQTRALSKAGSAPRNVMTIVSQRVVEVWDRDGLARQTVERSVWRRESS